MKASPRNGTFVDSRDKKSKQKGTLPWILGLGWISLVWLQGSSLLQISTFAAIPLEATPERPAIPGGQWKDQSHDLICDDPATSYLQVAPEPEATGKRRPSILCLVLTQEHNHATRLQTVLDTWGRKCDHLVAASNVTDVPRKAIEVKSLAGYWGIWDKLMRALAMTVLDVEDPAKSNRTELLNEDKDGEENETSGTSQGNPGFHFDWVLKADDDTYVIMENLRSFLANLTVDNTPALYGRRMFWPTLGYLDQKGWFRKGGADNRRIGKKLLEQYGANHTVIFPHGGPGYVMNWEYATAIAKAYTSSKRVIRGHKSEDLSNAVTMLARGYITKSTGDPVAGLERSHPETPQNMFENSEWLKEKNYAIENPGTGKECCSPTSISFHHMTPYEIRMLEYQLYSCPKRVLT